MCQRVRSSKEKNKLCHGDKGHVCVGVSKVGNSPGRGGLSDHWLWLWTYSSGVLEASLQYRRGPGAGWGQRQGRACPHATCLLPFSFPVASELAVAGKQGSREAGRASILGGLGRRRGVGSSASTLGPVCKCCRRGGGGTWGRVTLDGLLEMFAFQGAP